MCEQCGKETAGRFCCPECEQAFQARAAAYQEKLDNKRERLEARAFKFSKISDQAHVSADRMSSYIPLGQPILVGHHSEKRHRRDLERIHNGYRKSWEASKRAQQLQERAANVGSGGITSDDPEAISKLKEKLAGLEAEREAYKTYNKQARAAGKESLPAYKLTNLGANIRRVKGRIEELEKELTRPEAAPVEAEGYRMEEDTGDNRLRLFFDGKPCAEYRTLLKRWGFKWAPSVGAWQRQLTNNARAAAQVVLADFPKYTNK